MIEENLQTKEGKTSQRNEVILSAENVSKRFCRDFKRSMYYGIKDIGSEILGRPARRDQLRKGEFWALDNISFELRQGDALGLIGANGAGKTTILKIISGLIKPDTGSVRVRGKVAPLIALGAGFNPILTGRENIFINLAILGLSKKEIEDKYDEVVAFSEIGHAIEAPINTYSSGMTARLGFACAIHTNPDILLIDEVLAVGDIKFRMKCYNRLASLRKNGTSFILVSHGTQIILSMCDTVMYLAKGKMLMNGQPTEVMSRYEKDMFSIELNANNAYLQIPPKAEKDSTGVDITYVCFKDTEGNLVDVPTTGQCISLCIGCKIHSDFEQVNVVFAVNSNLEGNERVLYLTTENKPLKIIKGDSEICMQMPYIGLKRGLYTGKINLVGNFNYYFDAVEAFSFKVESIENSEQNMFYQPKEWIVSKID